MFSDSVFDLRISGPLHGGRFAKQVPSQSKIIKVSIDGANVNLKLYRDVPADRWNEQLAAHLDLGCCGLHVIHGALKTCVNATGWKMDLLLGSLIYLFFDSPARRKYYLFTSVSTSVLFNTLDLRCSCVRASCSYLD